MEMLIHDLRRLSTAIYNAAKEVELSLDSGNYFDAKQRILNVLATQTILKIRTDALDFAGNSADIGDPTRIPIYKKVDKVFKFFLPQAHARHQDLQLKGASFSVVWGPDIFEIVPYVLIENAIKYAPEKSGIEIFVSESSGMLSLKVVSHGPSLMPEETLQISDRGFRGNHARKSVRAGSGLGLHLAQKIVEEHFKDKISLQQGNVLYNVEGVPITEITFSVNIPINV